MTEASEVTKGATFILSCNMIINSNSKGLFSIYELTSQMLSVSLVVHLLMLACPLERATSEM
jgi:hypothetical protein